MIIHHEPVLPRSTNQDFLTATSFLPVARLSHIVPANQILRICTKVRDGERPSQEWRRACGRPSTTWVHQICCDTHGCHCDRGPAAGGG